MSQTMSSTPECPYIPKRSLTVQVKNQPFNDLSLTILKTFEPFTLSCAVLVELDWPSLRLEGQYVLKLFDRRFATQLRQDHGAGTWTPEIEAEYRDFVESGCAPAFFSLCASKDADYTWACILEHSWSSANIEAYLQVCCQKYYTAETAVYERLPNLQGTSIPQLLCCVTLGTSSTRGSTSEYLDCPGILMEYIEGFSLTDLGTCAPRDTWQQICDQAIWIINSIGEKDIRNRDVKTRSFIVSKRPQNALQVFMIDFGHCVLRRPDQEDDDWEEWKAMEDEEGAIGKVMERKLEKLGGGFVYEPTPESIRLRDKWMSE